MGSSTSFLFLGPSRGSAISIIFGCLKFCISLPLGYGPLAFKKSACPSSAVCGIYPVPNGSLSFILSARPSFSPWDQRNRFFVGCGGSFVKARAARLYEHLCSPQKNDYGPRRGENEGRVQRGKRIARDRMPRGRAPLAGRRPAPSIERSEPAAVRRIGIGIAASACGRAVWGRATKAPGGADNGTKRSAGTGASCPARAVGCSAKGWAAEWLETLRGLHPAGATARFCACAKLPRIRIRIRRSKITPLPGKKEKRKTAPTLQQQPKIVRGILRQGPKFDLE